MDKRNFLKSAATLGIGTSLLLQNLEQWIAPHSDESPLKTAADEGFWSKIRSAYKIHDEFINLESGYYCLIPEETLEKQIQHLRRVNKYASYYMREEAVANKKIIHQKLADLAGCDVDEIALTRNTTESLDTIISGIDWRFGDEAIYAVHDYGSMKNQFRLMERRYGVKNVVLRVPIYPQSDDEIVALYENAITARTRLIMVSHMINITGHILPIKKICDMAHNHGVEVMVDGAHTFAHLDFKIPDLACDYFGASLHKWLSVPLGAGLLYVKRDKIKNIWPLMAHHKTKEGDIMRLNHTGTHPVHIDLTVADAIDFYTMIGAKRKEERLRYLQRYWSDQLRPNPKIRINTPKEKHRSCAIANVAVKGLPPKVLANRLMDDYKIWTVPIKNNGVLGCRITPNVFTTTEELDAFVDAMTEIAASV